MKKILVLISLCIGILSACKTSKTTNSDDTNTATNDDFTIPNSFTPNGDGSNDVACFSSAQKKVKTKIQVFNRWGNVLWETENSNDCWDGLDAKTKQAYENGVYFVKIEANGVVVKKGNITLIR